MKKEGKIKGITLIALVITIIVILILVAVSIETLTGDNGILNQASNAAETQKKSEIKERVQTEVLASYSENGKLNKETLKRNLENNLGIDDITDNDNGSITFLLDEYEVLVKSEGTVEVGDKIPLIYAETITIDPLTVKVGQKVKINVITKPSNASENFDYKSENENIATVDKNGIVTGVGRGMTKIIVQGKKSKVIGECVVTVEHTITGNEVNSSIYGERVNYVAKDSSLSSLIWRIFYNDEDYVYLISSKMDRTGTQETFVKNSGTLVYETYKGSNDITNPFLQSLNSEWFKVLKGTNSEDKNAMAVAYLMDQTVWESYKDEEGKAKYAIGGPTIELYRNSFNATAGTRTVPNNIIEFTQLTVTGYYTNTGEGWLLADDNKGIYNINGAYWWLASPGIRSSNVCAVSGVNGRLGDGGANDNNGIRPVVAILKSDFEYNIID